MILAHIAGVPFEEWLAPVGVTGYYAYTVAKRRMAVRLSARALKRPSEVRGRSGALVALATGPCADTRHGRPES